jgi:multidrug efflux pump subunit AcrA (membrane-fusion protein)
MMARMIWYSLLFPAAILAGVPVWGQLQSQTSRKTTPQRTAQKATRAAIESQNHDETIEPISAVVKAIEDVPVPAQESGPVSKVLLKEGDAVTEGQLLVEMDTTTAMLELQAANTALEAALAKADDPSEIEYAQASLDLAIAELDSKLGINKERRNVVSESEIRKLRFAQTKAEKGLQAAMTARDIAHKTALVEKTKVAVAEHKLKRLKILSPLTGVVSNVYAQKGAWVNAGDPVAQVTRMDRLRVDFRVDTHQFNPSELVGRAMTIDLQLANGQTASFPGTITVVSPIAQKNSYFAQCEIENRQDKGEWLLRPGLSVEARMAPR